MDRYGVIGNPISHTKSPLIHRMFAEQCGQSLEYSAILSENATFTEDLNRFFETGLGLNVTVPFKLMALDYASELSLNAERAGAVNTLIKRSDGIVGENTDGQGLLNDLTKNLGLSLKNKTIVIIGAGGAAKGVLAPLLSQSPQNIVVANRTFSKATALCEQFSNLGELQAIAIDELVDLQKIDLLINASSAGLSGESAKLPNDLSGCFAYDMVYGAEDTPFLKAAKRSRCTDTADGLGMLIEQAALSFSLWRNVEPNTGPIIDTLRSKL